LGELDVDGENNIKVAYREMGYEGVELIETAQDRDQWRAVVNTVMILRVHKTPFLY
jgi:hypothetical protein